MSKMLCIIFNWTCNKKNLDLCNTQKHVGRRIFHKDEYLKFDKFHYKNRVLFAMYYDFECIIKDGKHVPLLVVYT